MTNTFTQGQTLYTADGLQVEYIGPVGDKHAVAPMYEDGDEVFADTDKPRIVAHLFIEEPAPIMGAKLTEAATRLRELQAQVAVAQNQIRQYENAKRDITRTTKQAATLQQIADFLDGRFKYVVTVDWDRKVEIVESVHNARLYIGGRGAGPIEIKWEWFDGSSGRPAHLCVTMDDAKAKVAELITGFFAQPERHLDAVIRSAEKHGIDVPPEIRKRAADEKRAARESRLAELRSEIAKIEKEIQG